MNVRTQQLLDDVEASLDEGDVVPDGVTRAWAEESERRLREIEAGAVKAIPASDVHRQLREKLGLGRCQPTPTSGI